MYYVRNYNYVNLCYTHSLIRITCTCRYIRMYVYMYMHIHIQHHLHPHTQSLSHTHTHSQKVQERWYESLHDWEAAYKAYQERQKLHPEDISLTLGKMRCLHAMGEWSVCLAFVVHVCIYMYMFVAAYTCIHTCIYNYMYMYV